MLPEIDEDDGEKMYKDRQRPFLSRMSSRIGTVEGASSPEVVGTVLICN